MLKTSAVKLSAPEILRCAEYQLLDAMPPEVREALQELESEYATFIAADMLNEGRSIPAVLARLEILNREWTKSARSLIR